MWGGCLHVVFYTAGFFDSPSLADNETKSKRMGYWVRQRLLYLYTCHMLIFSFSIIEYIQKLDFHEGFMHHGL